MWSEIENDMVSVSHTENCIICENYFKFPHLLRYLLIKRGLNSYNCLMYRLWPFVEIKINWIFMIVDSYFSDSKYGNVKNENNAATRLLYVQLVRLFWRLIPSISLMLGIKYSKLRNYFICPLIWRNTRRYTCYLHTNHYKKVING